MKEREADFYQQLRSRVRTWLDKEKNQRSTWTEYVLAAPDLFHLLCKLAADADVPRGEKSKLAVAIAYFISPLDLLPEAVLGPIGLLDDVALAAYVLNSILTHTRAEVVERHWAGDGDVLEVIQNIVAAADRMVGSGLWRKLRKLVR